MIQRHSGRCIYCAFRAQQFALQCRRLNTPAATTTFRQHSALDDAFRKQPALDDAFRKHSALDDRPTFRIRKESFPDLPDRRGKRRGDDGNVDFQKVHRRYDDSSTNTFRRLPSKKGHTIDAEDRKGQISFKNGKFEGVKADYHEVLRNRLQVLKEELKDAPVLEQLSKEKREAGEKTDSFSKVWKSFYRKVLGDSPDNVPWLGSISIDESSKAIRADLREAFRTQGQRGLDDRIKYAFYGHVTGVRFTESDIRNQKALADLRYPTEWFPATRAIHRTIHLHVGPTNSGKTYHALQRLEKAQRGVYAGPLRLLAHEVYTRMNAKGKPCALITGEERRSAENKVSAVGDVDMSACTVEMMPLNKSLDVAVIDEIQMIGNPERGWAWTQALLGVKATEVHLCGEERTVPLIRELCASVGEKLEIHTYTRLSPLKMADTSLDNDLRRLRKGDCIVSFSVMGIHALRRQIERQTGRKVATVYGSLPPETRAQQARLFNDPHNEYDFLVASDAVGMGLNLAIKRIIFETSSKFDGFQRRTLSVADIKQIAGRAGRYRVAEQIASDSAESQDLAAAKGDSPVDIPSLTPEAEKENVGFVTTLEPFDYPIVAAAMTAQPEPIRTAGLFPPASVLERFANYFPPGTPFSYILMRLHELSQMHRRFHLCGLRDQLWIADLIEPVKNLTIADRNVICSAPASKSDDMWKTLMPAYARCIADQTGGDILDIPELPLEILDAEVGVSREYLRELERLHKAVVTYLWLSYRFAGIFTTRALAFHIKEIVEGRIEEVLGKFSFSEASRLKVVERRKSQLVLDMSRAVEVEEEGGEGEEAAVDDTVDGARGQEGEGGVIGEMAEGDGEVIEGEVDLRPGSDVLSGEEDLPVEDPVEGEVLGDGKGDASASSFTEWRAQQTRELNRDTDDDDAEITIERAWSEGEEAAESAAEPVVADGGNRPAVSDVDQQAAAAAAAAVTAKDEGDSAAADFLDEFEGLVEGKPETEFDEPPTQVAPPRSADTPSSGNEPVGTPSRAESTPLKHLEDGRGVGEAERSEGRP